MAVVLITGTSTGIGLATALAVARAGHSVYATMRRPERAPELQTIAAAESLPVTILPLDVDNDASVRACFEQVYTNGGQLDVLINNAGVGSVGPIEELDLDVFRSTMETNYFGALRCIKAVLPHMREQRSGTIINVTSVAGRVAIAPEAPYCASKWALEALSEVLAQEVKAFNIRVALVEPGVIDTPMLSKHEHPAASHYPHERRLVALFRASLVNPTSADVVAQTIRRIVESDNWRLRYPAGPDARQFITWRKLTSDEDWIERYGEPDDDVWCARMEQDLFGLDLHSHLDPAPGSSTPSS